MKLSYAVSTCKCDRLDNKSVLYSFHLLASLQLVLACLCQLVGGGSVPSLTISLPDPVLEGTNLVISCITSGVSAGAVPLLRNGQSGPETFVSEV